MENQVKDDLDLSAFEKASTISGRGPESFCVLSGIVIEIINKYYLF